MNTLLSKIGDKWDSTKIVKILFWLFLLTGIASRIWQLNIVPGDINQDEAFAGYEAYSLLHYGMDSHGYRFPVYLVTWGSGMSALDSYLMIPFIALFGLKTWVIRLPQVIVACLTLWVVYLIVCKVINEKAALCALFLLAISPWHIMMSRWGMDANLAPGFLIFGLYFFIRGLEHSKYFLLSALMYGLSLYCYATIWPFVPIILLIQFIYCILYKKIKFSRNLLLSILLLGILALPLVLFLLVNWGIISEIRLPFLSIPKLLYMRDNEISFANILPNAKRLWHIVKLQVDELEWNSTDRYGLYYYGTLPFFFLGSFYYLKNFIQNLFRKKFSLDIFILTQLGAAVLLGLLIQVNINRVNILFIPMIIISATGVYYMCSFISLRLLIVPMLVYSMLFAGFEKYYFTEYKEEIRYSFCYGLEDAMTEATSHEGPIYISPGVYHSRIMFYSKEPVTEYLETVQYAVYPSAFLNAVSFGRFSFDFDAAVPDKNVTYILNRSVDLTPYQNAGFTLLDFANYTVAFYSEG